VGHVVDGGARVLAETADALESRVFKEHHVGGLGVDGREIGFDGGVPFEVDVHPERNRGDGWSVHGRDTLYGCVSAGHGEAH
jgi:hypothetical protein